VPLLITICVMICLFVPGLAVVHLWGRDWSAEKKIVFAPAVTILAYGLAGVLGWTFPNQFGVISWTCLIGLTSLGFSVLSAKGGLAVFRNCDPVLLWSYAGLAVFATQSALLPYSIPKEFPTDHLRATYYVQADFLPVRIQAMHNDLPNDNLLPYHFADVILRGVDLRELREIGCGDAPAIAPGQQVTARTPLMALAGTHFIKVFGRHVPVDHKPTAMSDYDSDRNYRPFFLACTCMNALIILPAYLIGLTLSGPRAARLAVVFLAANYGIVLHAQFIWPKELAGYFALLLAWMMLQKSRNIVGMGLCAALSYYSHPCGAGLVAGCFLFKLLTECRNWRTLPQLAGIGVVAALALLPWHLWSIWWIQSPGNLLSQNLSQNVAETWEDAACLRLGNLMRTVIPHMVGAAPVITKQLLLLQCFFTLPGMLGLVLVPVFGAAMSHRRNVIITATMGAVPLIITVLCLGIFAGGVAPFGAFLFVPIAMCIVCSFLDEASSGVRVGMSIAYFAEEALMTYAAIYTHWNELTVHSRTAGVRLVSLVVLQGLLAAAGIIIACRRESQVRAPQIATAADQDLERLAA
jgi:hypothetical protein